MGKQSGLLFYIPAWDTSKIDPTTGFVNLLSIKYTNIEEARKFIRKFDEISWDETSGYYRFVMQYHNFTNRSFGAIDRWTLCTYGNRIRTLRNSQKNNNFESQEVNLTEEFTKLLKEFDVNIGQKDLKESICSISEKVFYEKLFSLIKLMLQMRNSMTGTEIDYIISPVKNASGRFFDTREKNSKLPIDADANGAYNIAKKGLWAVRQIKACTDEKPKLAISNAEWLIFAQENPLNPNG